MHPFCCDCKRQDWCEHPCYEFLEYMNIIRGCPYAKPDGINKCELCKNRGGPDCAVHENLETYLRLEVLRDAPDI